MKENIRDKQIKKELIELLQQNPDLPIRVKIDSDIVGEDCYSWYYARLNGCEICELYEGRDYVHVKEYDDEEDVLSDMQGCKYCYTADGRDIYDLPDEEWKELYNGLPWVKTILITVGV